MELLRGNRHIVEKIMNRSIEISEIPHRVSLRNSIFARVSVDLQYCINIVLHDPSL